MTRLLEDIFKEPEQITRSLKYTSGPGLSALRAAADIVRRSSHTLVVGIGSSWHAGIAAHATFTAQGRPALIFDASELLHYSEIPPYASVILLSRSGRSVEIVRLIAKCRAQQAKIIAITNTPESPLALQADVMLPLMADFDHQVSISMYSALAAVTTLLAHETERELEDSLVSALQSSLSEAASLIPAWKKAIDSSNWLEANAPVYFLARGSSLATCHEARLLWEEVAKAPASALSTGSFRHGPQEIVRPGIRVAICLDPMRMRSEDLALAKDLCRHGANVLLVGHNLPADGSDLALHLPSIPTPWQFLIDIIPLQIAAERLAHLRGEDCDAFRLCPYIIEAEGGLPTAVKD